MSLTEKPTAEDLVTHITPFSCDAGFTFQLYCRYCYDSGRISGHSRDRESKKVLLDVAAKFVTAGWHLENNIPVCRICTLKRNQR